MLVDLRRAAVLEGLPSRLQRKLEPGCEEENLNLALRLPRLMILADPIFVFGGPQGVDRDAFRAVGALDEALVDGGAVEVGAADRRLACGLPKFAQ